MQVIPDIPVAFPESSYPNGMKVWYYVSVFFPNLTITSLYFEYVKIIIQGHASVSIHLS